MRKSIISEKKKKERLSGFGIVFAGPRSVASPVPKPLIQWGGVIRLAYISGFRWHRTCGATSIIADQNLAKLTITLRVYP